jgi:hypothetical protein
MPMTLTDYKKTPYAWPGGYQINAVMADGGVLCHDCTSTEKQVHEGATGNPSDHQWQFVGAEINWEGPDTNCDNCAKELPSEYGVA